MPEFLERRFSVASRATSCRSSRIITFIVSKIAVGIFAGGVVFGTLLPDLHITLGSVTIDSFWIGSVLVIVLTGLYTALGGMRAVAYNDTVQVFVLIIGSLLLTVYGLHELGGWGELRRIAGSDMFNLWKPLIPAGVEGTWAPVKEPTRMALVLQRPLPVARHGDLRADHRPLVLVHGPVHRAARARRAQRDRGAARQHLRRLPEAVSAVPVHHPRPDLLRAREERPERGAGDALFGPHADPNASQGAFPLMVQHLLPSGLRGIVVAGLLSALMGSLAGVFNACSTLFTVDIYEKWRPGRDAVADRAGSGAGRPS